MRYSLLLLAGVLVIGTLVWCALHIDISQYQKRPGFKRLSGTVAEQATYFFSNEKFPRATCSACRTGKVKLGHFSLGGLNTIEFDDLVLNMPAEKSPTEANNLSEKDPASKEVFESLGLSALAKSFGKSDIRFSGIKINWLELNQMDGDTLRPILKAKTLKNQREKIVLSEVTIYRAQEPEYIERATLEYKPNLRLVWDNDSWVDFVSWR